jgi:hypothetical protein
MVYKRREACLSFLECLLYFGPGTAEVNQWAGAMAVNLALTQRLQEALLTIESRHLNIGVADFAWRMSITANGTRQAMFSGEIPGFIGVTGYRAAGIEHFYDVNLPHQVFQPLTI